MDVTAQIESVEGKIAGTLDLWEMNHADLKAVKTFGDDGGVRPAVTKVPAAASGKGITCAFPSTP